MNIGNFSHVDHKIQSYKAEDKILFSSFGRNNYPKYHSPPQIAALLPTYSLKYYIYITK